MEYQKKTLTIQSHDGPQEVDAMVASNGLAYHLTEYSNGQIGPDWSVTHEASGHALIKEAQHLETPEQCQRFIELIDPLANWQEDIFARFQSEQSKKRWMEKTRDKLTSAAWTAYDEKPLKVEVTG